MTILSAIDLIVSSVSPHICKGCGDVPLPLCNSCYINYTNDTYNCCLFCNKKLDSGNLCDSCHKLHPYFNNLCAVAERRGALARLVGDYKYNSEIASAKIIARLLAGSVHEQYDAIAYIPTIPRHRRTRGFDHMEQVARELGKLIECPVNHRLMYRTDNLIQHEQSFSDRRTKIAQSLACRSVDLSNQHILLIDDIWTTGSTLSVGAKLLAKHGAVVDGMVVLRQPKNKTT